MLRVWLIVACAALSIGTAHANDVLRFGAPPAWVVESAIPAAKPADGPITLRLVDFQIRFGDKGTHQFARQILRVNSPEGLQIAGTIVVPWQPGLMSATVNRVVIHRGAETIDVMKDGKAFQILRRESRLEAATIDGVLTAVLSVPDLRVGDEIEMAFTIDQQNPVLGNHVESALSLNGISSSDRLAVRYSWPLARGIRWHAGAGLPTAKLSKAEGFQFLSLTRDAWTPPAFPAGAPGRFGYEALLQASDFSDWATVAAIMHPLYLKASTLGPGSPILAEVKRIAALSPDLKTRASEALRVVQSQVRYLARMDGLGGYLPESADSVWAGKSGDCKGKTVLLLAMLRALGVSAEPALVSATDGDGLDASIPMPGRFNHVIARATIDGKDYWLDGTRLGDRGIDTIAVPNFKWALPLDRSAATLVALVATEPSLAETETRLDFDARAGLAKPAKASGSIIYRGEKGSQMRVLLSMINASQRDEYLRGLWKQNDAIKVEGVTSTVDEKTGEVILSFSGTATMGWSRSGVDDVMRYQADNVQMGRDLTPKREKASIAPVAVEGDYTIARETILLPDSGKGFEVEGESIDRVVGGVRYIRTASIKDGKFEVAAISRNKPLELNYVDAQAADKQTDGLFKKLLFIRAPQTFALANAAAPEVGVAHPQRSLEDGNLADVTRLSVAGEDDKALALVDSLIAQGDKSGRTLATRARLLRRLGRDAEASSGFDQALAVDRREPLAIQGKADMLIADSREEDALILLDRLVLLWPEAVEAYRSRAAVRYAIGDTDGAMSDLAIVIDKEPDNYWARSVRADLFERQGKPDAALAEARAMTTLKPDDASSHALMGAVLARQGKRTAALAALEKSITLKPTVEAYDTRIAYRYAADAKTRLADMVALIKLAPESEQRAGALRTVLTDPAARVAIKQSYDDALDQNPGNEDILLQRDRMVAIGGDATPFLARLDALLAKKPGDADLLNQSCWARATLKTELDIALVQCDRSIAKKSRANTFDSRGLVRLQRGEWKEAEVDYGNAVTARPALASSLYGRGIALKRLGKEAASEADIAAALKIDPGIADTYASYQITP